MENKYSDEELIKSLPGFRNNCAEVNGTKLHYVEGGQGHPLHLKNNSLVEKVIRNPTISDTHPLLIAPF